MSGALCRLFLAIWFAFAILTVGVIAISLAVHSL
jgi:hypothetical protein